MGTISQFLYCRRLESLVCWRPNCRVIRICKIVLNRTIYCFPYVSLQIINSDMNFLLWGFCRFTITYSNNMTFATVKVIFTTPFFKCSIEKKKKMKIMKMCILSRVPGMQLQSTNQRNAWPCFAGGSLINIYNKCTNLISMNLKYMCFKNVSPVIRVYITHPYEILRIYSLHANKLKGRHINGSSKFL